MSCASSSALFQNSLYIGINVQNVLYGIELVLYLETMGIFLARRGEKRKPDIFLAIFSTVMVIMGTIWVISRAALGQQMWQLDRNHASGRATCILTNNPGFIIALGRTAIIILQQMADALMIYRCGIVWDSRHAVVVPWMLWFVNLAFGILVDWTSSSPATNFFNGVAPNFVLAFILISVFLNVILTCMICGRLLRHARIVKRYLGDQHASPYFSIVALVVESVLPFTLSGIAYLTAYGVGSQTEIAFLGVYALMMCISPQMLILRVAQGKAWQKHESGPPGSILQFSASRGDVTKSLNFEGNASGDIARPLAGAESRS